MKNKISLSELESLIRKNIQEKGLTEVGDDKIEEIKKKVKHQLSLPSAMFHTTMMPQTEYPVDSSTGLGGSLGDAVTGGMEESIFSPEEGSNEIQPMIPEKDLTPAYLEPRFLDPQSDQPQTTQSNALYQPKLPDFIEKAEPERIFIYNENELSVGAETLRTLPFHLVDSPEEKMSMEDIWLQKAKVRAEIYKIDFVKIGELVFQPNDGICKIERTPEAVPVEIPAESELTVRQAIQSQEPTIPMEDSVNPVMDVTLPLTTDMGLGNPDIQKATMDVIEKALRHYLMNKDGNDLA